MGGLGSGRWGDHRKATTAERCRVIDLAAIVRGAHPPAKSGELRWLDGETVVAAIGFDVIPADTRATVRLRYRRGSEQDVVLDVAMERVAIPRGGFRWWGRCPLARNGTACGRRIGKLYLPPRWSPYFGCRRCHRLAYASSQDHDRRVDDLLKNPEALYRHVHNRRETGLTMLGLILKALTIQQARAEREFRRFEKQPQRTQDGTTHPTEDVT